MAKVLLINSNRYKHPWPVIPFGLCYIATVLETTANHSVSFLDLCFSNNCQADIQKAIRKFTPDVIGISIRNIDDAGGYNVHFLLEDIKKDIIICCKEEFCGPIVIGGPSVGISGREMLEYFDLEYAVKGDGEAVMPEFVKRLENGQSLEDLEGLVIRRGNTIILENEPSRVRDLDALPFPQLSRWLNLANYRRFRSPLLIQTKRGCTFKCAYCTYNQIEGKQYRLRNPGLIADEIEILVKETGISHIEFADSVFNVPLAHSKDVLKAVIAKNIDLNLSTMALTPAAIDEELLDLMKQAGFLETAIAVESFCEPVLMSLCKDFNLEDIKKTANLLKKKKIAATWCIMLGAPAETRKTVLRTLKTVRKIISKWDLVFISSGVRVYNASSFAKELVRQDVHCTCDNFFRPVKIEPEHISLKAIHKIAKRFSFRCPNFYLYEKEHIVPGWILITGNFLLNFFHFRQPDWRMLILFKKVELLLGIRLVKRGLYVLKSILRKNDSLKETGFSLIRYKP